MKKLGFFLVLTLGLMSCTSAVVIQDEPNTVSEIRKVLTIVLGEPRTISQNGREFFSQYFDRKRIPLEGDHKEKEQLCAKIIILGDRRPYDISVEVLVEKNERGAFIQEDTDEGLADKIAADIKKQLHLSRSQEPNIIDDFRAF